MTSSVLDALPLTCPVCGRNLRRHSGSLVCAARHTFDLARQGYVNLAAGHYRPLAERVAELAAGALPRPNALVVDAGGGTGYYLSQVLDRVPPARGVVIDSSVAAVRRAAKAHPRAGAVAWNVWEPWPFAAGAADLVLDVFAPRNAEEFHRVLAPQGALLVVTPAPEHLAEVRDVTHLIGVDEQKPERLERALAARFRTEVREALTFPLHLDGDDVRRVVGMGPSAHHRGPDAPRAPGRMTATASFVLTLYRPVPR